MQGWRSPLAEEGALDDLIQFHGHMCVGLALGARAAEIGLREMGPEAGPGDLVVAVETNTCSVDAVQILTAATFGNGKLHHRDYAKNAYTFWRPDGKAVRVVAPRDDFRSDAPGFWEMFGRVQAGTASNEERAEFLELQQRWSRRVLEAPEEEFFRVEDVTEPPPARLVITPPVLCARCGEATMSDHSREQGGQIVCVPCVDRSAL